MNCPRCEKPSPYIGAQCTDCPALEPRALAAAPVPSRKPAWWPSGNPWTALSVIGVVQSLGWRWTWLGTDPREKFRVR
jgi:hypothetical protein